jgi:hypothetical protein
MLAIDLYGRFSSAFGYVAANIRTSTQPHDTPTGVEVYVADATFADLKLKSAKDGEEYEFRNSILTKNGSGIFAAAPMLKFTRKKKIAATAVAGSDNVVVESFGLEPWDITMNGILVDLDTHNFPSAKVQRLRQLFETPEIFDVVACQVMADLKIHALYFESLSNLTVLEDFPDTVKYELKARSIEPAEFTING